MRKLKGLIIIPAHNEEENLKSLIPEIKQFEPGLDIVVINDFSSDSTSEVARELGVNVIDLPCNLGYGGAVQTGFKYAMRNDFDFCVQIDGDGQHDPRSVKPLIDALCSNGNDVVLGSRFLGQASYKIPLPRKMGMKLFSRIIRVLTGMQITDPTSGYQALNARAIKFFANDNYPIDYPDADTLIVLNYSGFNVKEIPVHMRERTCGESMHSNLKAFYYLFKMFITLFVIMVRGKRYYRKVNKF